MNLKIFNLFKHAIDDTGRKLVVLSHSVKAKKWQGRNIENDPSKEMVEIFNHSFSVPIGNHSLKRLQYDINPNLPWADDHFLERVDGFPMNPGKQWANWPYAKSADTFRDEPGQRFTHTYMERYWPKIAGKAGLDPDPMKHNQGIWYEYGDLNDVVVLLSEEPNTRQAFLPVWFPEDTGAIHGGRVPCSIGYHFIHRNGYLHVNYWLRSCDFVRHFRDDIYLTIRLNLWILDRLRELDSDFWGKVKPGYYTQHTTSMHCFKSDLFHLKKVYGDK